METSLDLRGQVAKRIPIKRPSIWHRIVKGRSLLLMLLPGLILIAIFDYGPMYGVQIAFKDFHIMEGIWGSPWVGLDHFKRFFTNPRVLKVFRNTIEISLLRLVCGFPSPIILALLINEVKSRFFKRFTQTVSYLPHFLSWVVIAALVYAMLSPSSGIINIVIQALGFKPVFFMAEPSLFRPILIVSSIWKEVGWGSILYLAALSNVDVHIYEAAIVDGANRVQRMWYISLPTIMPVVTISLILSMGGIMNAGFDQIFNLYNSQVYEVGDIIDTFVYRIGLLGMEYSFTAAVGLFKSVVGLVMILTVNSIARRLGDKRSALW